MATPGKHVIQTPSAVPVVVGRPQPSQDYTETQVALFEAILNSVEANGVSAYDVDVFVIHEVIRCKTWLDQAAAGVDQFGLIVDGAKEEKRSPYFAAYKQTSELFLRYLVYLGLTPDQRRDLNRIPTDPDEDDGFESV